MSPSRKLRLSHSPKLSLKLKHSLKLKLSLKISPKLKLSLKFSPKLKLSLKFSLQFKLSLKLKLSRRQCSNRDRSGPISRRMSFPASPSTDSTGSAAPSPGTRTPSGNSSHSRQLCPSFMDDP